MKYITEILKIHLDYFFLWLLPTSQLSWLILLFRRWRLFLLAEAFEKAGLLRRYNEGNTTQCTKTRSDEPHRIVCPST